MQQILYRSRYDGGDFQSGTEHRWEDPADTRRYPSDRCRTRSLDSQNIDWNWVCADGDIPCQKGKNPVINARVETVMDKPSFSERNLISPAVDSGRWVL